jgi:hypothetical protein
MRCAAATSERETDREDLVMRPPLMARNRGRPLQFRSMIAGFPLPPTEILTGALVDPVEALGGARLASCHCMGKVEMPKLAYRYDTLTPSPARPECC